MTINTELNELSKLTLVACDASYLGLKAIDDSSWGLGSELRACEDTESYEFPIPYGYRDGFKVAAAGANSGTGFKFVVFRNEETNEVVIAMAGTDGPNFQDWAANLKLGWDQWDRDGRDQIFNYLNQLQSEGFTGKIHFTGQSLGGALAEYAAFEYVRGKTVGTSPDPNFDPTRVTLTTFNGLGSKDGLVAYGNFDRTEVNAFGDLGSVAHYFVTNDLISRIGGGHIGGPVYELAFKSDRINPATGQPYLLNPIEAHRIETGFYREFAKGGILGNPYFLAAQRRDDFVPLNAQQTQQIAGYFAGLSNQRGISEVSARYRFMGAVMVALREAPAEELKDLVPVLADVAYRSGWMSGFAYEAMKSAGAERIVRELKLFAQADKQAAASALLGALFYESTDWSEEAFASTQALMPTDLQGAMEGMNGTYFDVAAARERIAGALTAARLMLPASSADRALVDQLFVDSSEVNKILFREGPSWASGLGPYIFDLLKNRPEDLGQVSALFLAAFNEWSGDKTEEAGQTVLGWAKGLGNAFADLSRKATDVAYDLGRTFASFKDFSIFPSAYAAQINRSDLDPSVRALLEDAREIIQEIGQTVVILPGRGTNPFDANDFDPDAIPVSADALKEGSVKTFTLYLPYEAGAGGQTIKLELAGAAAGKLSVLGGADEVDLDEDGTFELIVAEGRREVSFGLLAQEDVDADETLELSATLVDSAGEATHLTHNEAAILLDAQAEVPPGGGREIRGDWAPKPYTNPATLQTEYRYDDLSNIERLPGVLDTTNFHEPDDSLRGSSGADHIVASNSAGVVHAFGGDDSVTGSGLRANILLGGAGNDWIEGGGYASHATQYNEYQYLGRTIRLGDDKIHGGAGDDQIWGESEATQVDLYDANVAATGLPGDWIAGGTGEDRVYGSAGDDVLQGGVGEDLLVGGAGMDVLLGDDDFGIAVTGNFWRVLHTNFGDPTYSGFEVGLFPVYNYYPVISIPDAIDPNIQDPYVTYYKDGGGADTLVGGTGKDILIGQSGDDALYGGDDDDILAGWEGADRIYGGAGNDRIAGDFGRYEQADQRPIDGVQLVRAGVLGSSAASGSAVEQAGNDLIDGGTGADTIYGEGGSDVLIGGEGNDTLFGDAAYLPAELQGADLLDGGAGDDLLVAGGGDDRVYAGAGTDSLDGGDGNDYLNGGTGNDSLVGDAGDDTLIGGEGADQLQGGPGNDTFMFDSGDGRDLIEDSEGDNRIVFRSGISPGQLNGEWSGSVLTLTYGSGQDAFAVNLAQLRLGGVDFADGTSWTRRAFLDFAPPAVTEGSAANNELTGVAYARSELRGLGGDDRITGGENDDTLVGGDGADTLDGRGGSDRYVVNATDSGVDVISDSDMHASAYVADYYRSRGILDWEERVARPNQWRVTADGGDTTYHDSQEHALTEVPYGTPVFIAPLTDAVPRLTRDDPQYQQLVAVGVISSDVLEFGPGLELANLEITVAVDSFSAQDFPDRPWINGGQVSIRWSVDGGVNFDAPAVDWGHEGTDLLQGGWIRGPDDPGPTDGSSRGYRLGEGIEAFRFGDGTTLDIDQLLAHANVIVDSGAYEFKANSGYHLIDRRYEAIEFSDSIMAGEVQVTRDGLDLLLSAQGAQGRIRNWYADPNSMPVTSLMFQSDPQIDAPTLTALGLAEVHGGDGHDTFQGLDGFVDRLFGEDGDDFLSGGSGDDTLYGGEGDDILSGGPGIDYLEGGGGGDIYMFGLGGGFDQIFDGDDTPGNQDTLRFAAEIAPGDVGVTQDQGSFYLVMSGGADRIMLDGMLVDAGGVIERLEFADGTLWTPSDIAARAELLPSTIYGDVFWGTAGDDAIASLEGDDALYGNDGNDILLGGEGNDYAEGGDGNNLIEGGAGDDTLWGGVGGVDLYMPGEGDDSIYLATNGSVVSFNAGDGSDTIYTSSGAAFTLSIGGATAGDLSLSTDGYSVILEIGPSDAVSISNLAGAPAYRPEVTLQIIGSVHTYVFNTVVEEFLQAKAQDPGLAHWSASQSLAAHLISDDDTQAIGGAIAFRYGITGSTGNLTTAQIHSVLAEPGFGESPQEISVVATNHAPKVTIAIADQLVPENAPFGFTVSAGTFSDPDAGDLLSYMAVLADGSALPTWLSFDEATGTFSGTPGNSAVGSLDITVTASDPSGGSASDTFRLGVLNANDAPLGADDVASVEEDGRLVANGNVLANDSDVDRGTVLSVANPGNYAGAYGALAFGADGAYVYTLANNSAAVQSLAAGQTVKDTFAYTVRDDDANPLGDGAMLVVSVAGANDAPVLASPISDCSATVGQTFSLQLASNTFTDADQRDVLAYGATLADGDALPAWLSFDAASRTFNGTPGVGDAGTFGVRVTASDPAGASASNVYSLAVAPPDGSQNGRVIVGTNHGDSLVGTESGDLILGLQGDDRLEGRGGNDVLHAGNGMDFLVGGGGNDLLSGGAGADVLQGGEGTNFFAAGDGSDRIATTGANDIIAWNRGDGPDEVTVGASAAANRLTLSFGGGVSRSAIGFKRNGDRLVVDADGEAITLANWYALPATQRPSLTLQVIGRDVYRYDVSSATNALRDRRSASDAWQSQGIRASDPVTGASQVIGGAIALSYAQTDCCDALSADEKFAWLDSAGFGAPQTVFGDAPRDHDHEDAPGSDEHHHDNEHDSRDQRAGESGERRDEDHDNVRDRIGDSIAARLARSPRFDFEVLAREMERGSYNDAPGDIRTRWQAVTNYVNGLGEDGDEHLRRSAPFGWERFAQGGITGAAAAGFGYAGSIGASRGVEGLRTLQGLEEGFRPL